ncbi:Transmembrane protease serine 2 [Collichthys lucidus]|uniref:Transmembrane protease serine 2 n=1 Tax=Collichthys lucidus TaxID=240159 RepID=A0A4U5VAF7_COLLU|nr:Transmembrane protease serine 2 [Collichthys lucidus]TKS83775.1 Transmembrane protease serine 2 [Collichthys lucidus]
MTRRESVSKEADGARALKIFVGIISGTGLSMYNNQRPPVYDNIAFQQEEGRPPPYAQHQGLYPSLPQQIPSYVAVSPTTINTHQTGTPGTPQNTGQKKDIKKCPWKHILSACLCVFLILAVAGLLLWYFFRLHGTNFILQSYSSDSEKWMPVCAENWDDNYGRAVCEQIGQDYAYSAEASAGFMASKGYMKLKAGSDHGSRLQSQLAYSQTCSAHAVKLKCIDCGESSAAPSTRIVGGTAAVNGAWPWQVSLQIHGRHICAGSIISPYWILSAAHCFQTYNNPDMWLVYSGDVRLSRLAYGVGTAVEQIINHEDYAPHTNDNDVALLKLHTPLTFSATVKPVCLPNVGVDLSPERQAWITGWGALRSSGRSPDTLNQAQVTIYSRETCNRPDILNGEVTEAMICAGKLQGGVDTCQGDSGGPLVVKEGNVWWLVGDTSWGIGCAWENKPGVYGNVIYFIDWVYKQMQNE